MQDELRALIVKHCETLHREAVAIAACIDLLQPDFRGDDEPVSQAIDLAHRVKGSSGSIGFREISECARDLEFALRALFVTPQAASAEAVRDARSAWKRLKRRIDFVSPEESSLFAATLTKNPAL